MIEASTFAPRVDGIFWMLVGISAAIMLLVGVVVLVFSFRYRRGTGAPPRFTARLTVFRCTPSCAAKSQR